MGINNKKDILLLLLYSPGKSENFNEPICGRTRIIKMMYLFKKEALKFFKKNIEITEENFYDFFPWHFGPFSTEVYDDIAFFLLQNFIEEDDCFDEPALPESEDEWDEWQDRSGISSEEDQYSEYSEIKFELTKKGEKFVESELWEHLSNNQKNLLKEFKAKTVSVPLRALMRYVYANYPEDTEKSQIKKRYT